MKYEIVGKNFILYGQFTLESVNYEKRAMAIGLNKKLDIIDKMDYTP